MKRPATRAQRTHRYRPLRTRRAKVTLLLVVLLLCVPGVSFAQAMTYPGNAPSSVRAVEWVRDHGGGGLVDRVETWVYSREAPPATGDPVSLPLSSARPTATVAPPTRLPQLATMEPALSGEGQWTVVRHAPDGTAALATSWLRPDPDHTTVLVGVALLSQRTTNLHLGAGTREPVPGLIATSDSQVQTSDREQLLAAFNAGFKMRDTGGGWYLHGRTVLPLRNGFASLVIDQRGRAQIGVWGSDVTMGPNVAAVRQNLHLVVVAGKPVAGLGTNNRGQFGTGQNQFQYTWRSGLGTNAQGDLGYVAGEGLTLATLADAMVDAGIVTGMELDIHHHQVAFNSFADPAHALSGLGQNLLPRMDIPRNRYLVPDQRDFLYVTAR